MDLSSTRRTRNIGMEDQAFQIKYEEEVFAKPGERLDMDTTNIDPQVFLSFKELTCPKCGVTGAVLPWGMVKEPEGFKAIGECQNCKQKIASYKQICPVFSWLFDWNSHEVWWDVKDMLQLVAKYRPHCYDVNIPPEWVKWLFDMNCENAVSDHDYAMSKDLNEPILIIAHPSHLPHRDDVKTDSPPILPVDGWHRIYKASKLGLPLKAIMVHPVIVAQCVVKDVIYVGNGA